jgi:hypothetical protein
MGDQPPIYNQLLQAGSDPTDRTVTVVIGTDATHGVRIDMSLDLIGPLMGALAAEAEKLNAGLSEEERSNSSTLNARSIWLSQDAEGHPMMVFELANGSLLPLAITGGDSLAGFARELTLLAGTPGERAN